MLLVAWRALPLQFKVRARDDSNAAQFMNSEHFHATYRSRPTQPNASRERQLNEDQFNAWNYRFWPTAVE